MIQREFEELLEQFSQDELNEKSTDSSLAI